MTVCDEIGQPYLNQFDNLDLSIREQRRMAVYCMKEFYSSVLSDVARTELGIDEEIKNLGIDGQWNRVTSRFESLEDYIQPPDGSNEAIYTLKQLRSNSHHNTDFDPSVRKLQDYRELAHDWRKWVIKQAKKYREIREVLEPRETIIDITYYTLQDAQRDAESEVEDDEVSQRIASLLSELDNRRKNEVDISLDLVYILKDALDVWKEAKLLKKLQTFGVGLSEFRGSSHNLFVYKNDSGYTIRHASSYDQGTNIAQISKTEQGTTFEQWDKDGNHEERTFEGDIWDASEYLSEHWEDHAKSYYDGLEH